VDDAFAHRPAEELMSAQRAGCVLADALSFPRAAMRELVRGRYQVRKLRFELDEEGKGEILYQLVGQGRTFHFFLVSDLLPESVKIDRNFAQGWDAMGVLCEGEWSAQREAHLRREVPRQRAGYADYDTLMYARGNRSGRIFEHVVQSLAEGRQPEMALLAPIGYILRTTAFIGNGQLGTRPLSGYEPDHPFRRPYHAQFFSAFMLREYVFDLVEHLARVRNPDAARLAPAYRRYIGVGNSAATGLAAYAANHARQMQQWTRVHEEALVAAVRKFNRLTAGDTTRLLTLLERAIRYFDEGDKGEDGVFTPPAQTAAGLRRIARELLILSSSVRADKKTISLPRLVTWARTHVGGEAVEVFHSLLLELDPALADAFVDDFLAEDEEELPAETSAGEMLALLHRDFGWMLHAPLEQDDTYFWYRCSSAPRDIRRGLRGRVPALEFETNLDMPRRVRELAAVLRDQPASASLASVLAAHPELRHAAARAQALSQDGNGVLREQWLSARYSPFNAIRFVLSFYGMEKFEAAPPKSVRGTFMQGAPIAEDVAQGRDGAWPHPLIPDAAADLRIEELAPAPPNSGRPTPVTIACGELAAPQALRIAPDELRRMIAIALQGHGMPLGHAQENARWALCEQAYASGGVRSVLDHVREGGIRSQPRLEGGLRDGRVIEVDARGSSALNWAALAADVAIERVFASNGSHARVRVTNARDPRIVRTLVQRCAGRGLAAALLWRSDGETGLAAAGPQGEGSWLALASLSASDVERLAPDVADLVLSMAQGFVMLCARPERSQAREQLRQLTGSGLCEVPFMQPAEVARMHFRWHREGVVIARAEFDALQAAGAALLVPQSHEALVLHEGADPLKTF
jgi:hypothetical protein